MVDSEEIELEGIVSEENVDELMSLLHKHNRKLMVDWKKISDIEGDPGAYESDRYWKIMDALKKKGILSTQRRGNYILISQEGVELNPTCNLSRFYFTDKENAEKYKNDVFGKAMYRVDVFRLS